MAQIPFAVRPALLAVLAVALAGCFQMSSVLSVRADGSATLRDELTLSGMGLMALAEEAGGEDPWDQADFEARAAALGEGVRLVSFEPREDGFAAVYEVADVRTLRYSVQEGMGSSDVSGDLAFAFGFDAATADAPATLRVLIPKPAQAKTGPPVAVGVDASLIEEPAADAAERSQQVIGMMRSFLEDARLTVAVEVEGEITQTNAAFAEGARVTLFDLPFGPFLDAMADNPSWMSGGPTSAADMYDRVAEVEGIRIERPRTVRVRFR